MKQLIINCLCCLLTLLCGTQAWGQTQLRVINGSLRITGDVNVVLTNTDLTNNASVTATAGTVIFRGATANNTIGGTNGSQLHNLTIDKPTNNVNLDADLSVAGAVNLLNGLLELTNFDLALGDTATLQSSSAINYISTSGTGEVTRLVENGDFFNFIVGLGSPTHILLENSGTGDTYRVRVANKVLTQGTTGTPYNTNVVDQTWYVSEEVPGGSDLSLTVEWFAGEELPALDRNNCYVAQYDGGWMLDAGGPASGDGPFQASRSGITSVSQFAVASGVVLPVELLQFTGETVAKTNVLHWVSANEEVFSHYEVQRSSAEAGASPDSSADRWEVLGAVAGAMQGQEAMEYNYMDYTPPASAYYRLRMVDLDGSFAFSPIIRLENPLGGRTSSADELAVFPNPNSGSFTLTLPQATEPLNLAIYSVNGTCVRAQKIASGTENLALEERLAPGVYLLVVEGATERWTERVVVR